MYNFFTSEKGAHIIVKGWKKAEIVGTLDGSITIPSEDPFDTIYASSTTAHNRNVVTQTKEVLGVH